MGERGRTYVRSPDDEEHRQVKPSVYAGLQTFIASK